MDISDRELAPEKEEDQIVDVKSEIVIKEPRETVNFIKCEMCNENSDNEKECVHFKNDRLDDKLQVTSLCSADGLHNNSFKEHVKSKVENANHSSFQNEEDFILKLINPEVMVKEEEYFDTPEYLSTNMDFVECDTGKVKTEDVNDIYCENVKIESVKEEPTDNEASLSSGMLAQDEERNDVYSGSSKESLKDCRKRVSETNKNTFQCQVCPKICSSRFHLAEHNVTHTKEKRFYCQFCSKSYNKICNLVIHERIHTGEKPFSCKFCSQSFSIRHKLVTHEIIHTGENQFNCNVCSKSFSDSYSLAAHEKMHNGEKIFNCEVCSKSFSTRCNLETHERIHTGLFNCKICSQDFSKLCDLMRHELTHAYRKFDCNVCCKSFSSKCNLLIHEKIHTGEKPFDCKICSKSFRQRSVLMRHERTHAVDKLFDCRVCLVTFCTKLDLVTHAKIHTGENPFNCIV